MYQAPYPGAHSGDDSLAWSAEFTMTACRDTFEREVTGGWGVGPLGAWDAPSSSSSVDGSVGTIDHVSGLANLPHQAAASGEPSRSSPSGVSFRMGQDLGTSR